MADFLRPEVRAFFWRWREVIIALSVALFGLYWALDGVGITVWLGFIFIAIGLGWAVAGFQRARFAQGGDGPGVVQVRERRLAYFGPLDGGVIDVADLTKLELDPSSHPDPSWILTGIEGQRIAIPINAQGAESLFDVFSALPGIKTEAVLDVLSHTPDVRVTLWSRTKPLLH
ncbi:hypothetical protein SLH49_18965 [Cognatiyoonia sp. IB215446]|uniref:hypothetical protein n=1 Tax=Cognatiyoonia sp. IB215446 TaxID=3097355 RepID=UPI002A0D5610|nr:hypothetical protein [Cognatiyoonia sp. IB215446]MDX8350077.1 hypothetical protein [Cognatiyoonia sp. IB215446]